MEKCRLLSFLLLLLLVSTVHAAHQLADARVAGTNWKHIVPVRWSLTGRKGSGGHGGGRGHGRGRGHGTPTGTPENGTPTMSSPRYVAGGTHGHGHRNNAASSGDLSYSPLAISMLLGAIFLWLHA